MALHVKVNMQTSLVNQETNPEMFNGDGDRGMSITSMQSLVAGDIQIIKLNKPVQVSGVNYVAMGVNEEGKFSGMKFNAVATRVAVEHSSVKHGDVIVGDAILFEAHELT